MLLALRPCSLLMTCPRLFARQSYGDMQYDRTRCCACVRPTNDARDESHVLGDAALADPAHPGAIILVGGIFYLRTIVTPSIATPNANVDEQFGGRRAAWAMWVGIATLLLLVTGLWNYMQIIKMNERMASSYHMIAGLKMLAGIALFLLAALVAGRSTRCGNDAAADAVLAECMPAGRNRHRGSRQRAADLPAHR